MSTQIVQSQTTLTQRLHISPESPHKAGNLKFNLLLTPFNNFDFVLSREERFINLLLLLDRNSMCSYFKTVGRCSFDSFIAILHFADISQGAATSAMNQNSLQHSGAFYARQINRQFISNCKVVSGESDQFTQNVPINSVSCFGLQDLNNIVIGIAVFPEQFKVNYI